MITEEKRKYLEEYRQKNKKHIAEVAKKKAQRTRKQINAYHCKYQKGAGREKYLIRLKTYKRLRKDIIEDRKVCEKCGSNKNLQIHHLEYKFDKEYLMLLCRKCHNEIHNSSQMFPLLSNKSPKVHRKYRL